MTADPRPCPGSLQMTMAPNERPTPCPVCRAPVPTIRLDGRPVLAEHRRRGTDALTIDLWSVPA